MRVSGNHLEVMLAQYIRYNENLAVRILILRQVVRLGCYICLRPQGINSHTQARLARIGDQAMTVTDGVELG